MNKSKRRFIVIYELIMFILVIISLNDNVAEKLPIKLAPIFCTLMGVGAVVALMLQKDNK